MLSEELKYEIKGCSEELPGSLSQSRAHHWPINIWVCYNRIRQPILWNNSPQPTALINFRVISKDDILFHPKIRIFQFPLRVSPYSFISLILLLSQIGFTFHTSQSAKSGTRISSLLILRSNRNIIPRISPAFSFDHHPWSENSGIFSFFRLHRINIHRLLLRCRFRLHHGTEFLSRFILPTWKKRWSTALHIQLSEFCHSRGFEQPRVYTD
ncbi:hypothetical protein ES332_A11G324600v1 [Gossypium tomentosum]|uniref:Uncharacterized protein n=1 Tax=Gossypium tomentosum TaxID=34277 RepID=A0A5D2NGL9_GOSTO|nr:hypothetical protein ES332_A11G324600v1 [Gossypium tomentosum]